MKKLLSLMAGIFNFFEKIWALKKSHYLISNGLILSFILGVLLFLGARFGLYEPGNPVYTNPFFAIDLSFTLLLIIELLSLIFVLPRSVATSNYKQYALLSLIFLRYGFKEFSHIHSLSEWSVHSPELIDMFVYGLGGLAIFIIVNLVSKMQKHVKISRDEDARLSFINFKKSLALLLLLLFFLIGFFDIRYLIETGLYRSSFEAFYTVLVFSDILIVLFALRYTSDYLRVFRYSAFVLSTIFIRIALSLPALQSVALGVAGALFVLALTYSYNRFITKPDNSSSAGQTE